MTRRVLTLPPWQAPQSTNTRTSASTINNAMAGSAAASVQKTSWGLADGELIPVLYGKVSVGAIVPTVVKHPGGDLLLLCVFAANACLGIDKLYVGGSVYSGRKNVYLGVQTDPDSWLRQAFAGAAGAVVYDDVLAGYTYAVLRFAPGSSLPSLSSIRAIVRGAATTADDNEYDNPAHCLAHFAVNYMGLAVETTGLQETAERCSELVAGEKRRTLSLAMKSRTSKADWLATLAEYAGCYYYIADNTLHLIAKRPRDVSHTITPADIMADSLTLSRSSLSSVANRISVNYTVPTYDDKAWNTAAVTVALPDVPLAKVRESNISMPGFTSASMATRHATERMNEQNLCDLKAEFECPNTKAAAIQVGEVISVTSGIGLANKQFAVLSNVKQTVNKSKITAVEYDEAVFSDAVVIEPSAGDTSLPVPSQVAPVSQLSVSELLKANKSGITHSYLLIGFTGEPSHTRYDVEVYDKKSMATPVWTAYATPSDRHTTAALPELNTYVVNVRAANAFGFSSEWEAFEIYTGGKLVPPADVADIAGVELGGIVYLSWSMSYDMDLRDYVIKWMPVGDAWDSWFAKEANTIAALHDAVPEIPAGRWDFAVKARDWAGNLSVNEARCTVDVDDESAASGDIHDYVTDDLSMTNMAAIDNGFFDVKWLSKQRYVTTFVGDTLNNLFTQPFGSYPDVLANYHSFGDSSVVTNVHDFGLVVNGQWSGFVDVQTLDGATTEVMQISTDNSIFTNYPLSAKTAGRYVKLQVDTTGTMLVTIPKLQVRATTKQRSETGQGRSLTTGLKRIALANHYYGLVNVTVQAIGFGLTGGVEGVHLDPNDTNYIDVFVIDASNNRVAADFTFTFTGR